MADDVVVTAFSVDNFKRRHDSTGTMEISKSFYVAALDVSGWLPDIVLLLSICLYLADLVTLLLT